ncbi:hypothetical protein FJ970_18010 [Mesorhizobium sp. B2-1-8]|uniref:hypothetical protein n=1 Tax=Mesorhizobium sp. B2-1-8 TaxID=2589967 RepID=UPI00112835E1|nr:hypothetical protein [Mesorhizobium sp. B2-1-8]UCI17028.1 hypothetical protein FJ970_18010 [Mesorhizobium sp. B2-1-8]
MTPTIEEIATEIGTSPSSIRRLLVKAIDAAEMDTSKGMPIMMDQDEASRLHGIAHAAALQAIGGAKEHQIDELAAKVFRLLAASVGRSNASYADRRESIRVVSS